jgi:hypothetical protein
MPAEALAKVGPVWPDFGELSRAVVWGRGESMLPATRLAFSVSQRLISNHGTHFRCPLLHSEF